MTKIFRRYNSTIYGNYKKYALVYGLAIGCAQFVVVAFWNMVSSTWLPSPENYVTEVVLLAGIFGFTYLYRRNLKAQAGHEGSGVTLKELLLLGLGMGCVGAVVYGLWMWLYCGTLMPTMVEHFNEQRIVVMPEAETGEDARKAIELVSQYTAGDWAFIGGFRTAVMSVMFAFFAALIFRTEYAPVREKEEKTKD